jgi:hypothetical protein
MNTTFKIPYNNSEAPAHIIVEIGASNIAIFCYSTYPFTANGFYYYSITENDSNTAIANELKAILESEKLTAITTDDVHIFYNYAESTLIPTSYFKQEEINNIANLMFGNKSNCINMHENISTHRIENIFAVPMEIKNTMDIIFPSSKSMHSLSKSIQSVNGTKIYNTVYDKEIRLVLFKENIFTLASYFEYTTPEDVCYHMLNVCERFAVSTSDVEVILNGMIDTNSNLYKEIYKFFMQISIEDLPEKVMLADGFEEIASHYFSPLVKLAKCVS